MSPKIQGILIGGIIAGIIAPMALMIALQRPTSGDLQDVDYVPSLASYDDFEQLVDVVRDHRQQRLINADTFVEMSQRDDVVILDSRSRYFYDRSHLSGALHLDFSEYTQESLDSLLLDHDVTILIYCNNNILNDPINFASKTSTFDIGLGDEERMLALNIPSYINLYGYGYKNVYELNEMIGLGDERFSFTGSNVANAHEGLLLLENDE